MPKQRIFRNPAAIEKWVRFIRQTEADADDNRVGSLINQGGMELNRTAVGRVIVCFNHWILWWLIREKISLLSRFQNQRWRKSDGSSN